MSAGAQPATQLALRHSERVQALVLISPALHLLPKPGFAPESGPPGFVLDYVLASDFIVWVLVHLAPNLLLRVAGVPRSLDDQVTAPLRKEFADGFSSGRRSARGAGTTSVPPRRSPLTCRLSSCGCR